MIIQYQRRIVKIFKPVRIDSILKRQNMDVLAVALLQNLTCRRKFLVSKCSAPLWTKFLRIFARRSAVDRLGRSELLKQRTQPTQTDTPCVQSATTSIPA